MAEFGPVSWMDEAEGALTSRDRSASGTNALATLADSGGSDRPVEAPRRWRCSVCARRPSRTIDQPTMIIVLGPTVTGKRQGRQRAKLRPWMLMITIILNDVFIQAERAAPTDTLC